MKAPAPLPKAYGRTGLNPSRSKSLSSLTEVGGSSLLGQNQKDGLFLSKGHIRGLFGAF